MAKILGIEGMHIVPPAGQAERPEMTSLCRSVALVNAAAFFLESMQPAAQMTRAQQEAFIARGISIFALNVHTITGADSTQTRADVQLLADTLGIELYNLPVPATEGQVN